MSEFKRGLWCGARMQNPSGKIKRGEYSLKLPGSVLQTMAGCTQSELLPGGQAGCSADMRDNGFWQNSMFLSIAELSLPCEGTFADGGMGMGGWQLLLGVRDLCQPSQQQQWSLLLCLYHSLACRISELWSLELPAGLCPSQSSAGGSGQGEVERSWWSQEDEILLVLLKVSLKYLVTSKPELPSIQVLINCQLSAAPSLCLWITSDSLLFLLSPRLSLTPSSDLLAIALNEGFAEKSKASSVVKDALQ